MKIENPGLLVECLVPDWAGDMAAVDLVANSGEQFQDLILSIHRVNLLFKFSLILGLDVYAHNIETVERMTPMVRDPRATYKQSMETLERAKKNGPPQLLTKTSLMLGLGETDQEIIQGKLPSL